MKKILIIATICIINQMPTKNADAANATGLCPDGYTTIQTSMTYTLDYNSEYGLPANEAESICTIKLTAPSCNTENPDLVCWPQAGFISTSYQDETGKYTFTQTCYF